MRQIEARNAVNSIKLKLIQLIYAVDEVKALENALSIRHFLPAQNCRKATPDELRQLCAASNVVVFPAA